VTSWTTWALEALATSADAAAEFLVGTAATALETFPRPWGGETVCLGPGSVRDLAEFSFALAGRLLAAYRRLILGLLETCDPDGELSLWPG
jgi:hypothetical protein